MKILKYFAVILIVAFASCEKLLETEPREQISDAVAMEDISGINAVLIGAYNQLQATGYYGRDALCETEMLADNCKLALSNSNRFPGHPTNEEGDHVGWYTEAYTAISRVNNVLKFVDDVNDGSQEEIDQAKGEAYFIRALCYFDLAKAFGYEPGQEVAGFDLSVVIETEPFAGDVEASWKNRNTNQEVYDQVEADLLLAIPLLEDADFPFRGSKAAAYALLSRLYLYTGQWADAVTAADNAIAETTVDVVDAVDYPTVWGSYSNTEGAESLFELAYESTEVPGSNSAQSIYLRDAGGNGYGDIISRQDLIDQFDQVNDIRWTYFLQYDKSGEIVHYTLKYNDFSSGTTYHHNVPILRIAEVYLNKAEALAEQGQDAQAQTAVNYLRAKRGLADLATTGQALIDDILLERRMELCFEGHRWFDLKRKGLDVPKGVDGIDCDDPNCVIPYENYKVLARFGTTEVEANPSLLQNPGY